MIDAFVILLLKKSIERANHADIILSVPDEDKHSFLVFTTNGFINRYKLDLVLCYEYNVYLTVHNVKIFNYMNFAGFYLSAGKKDKE